MGQERIAFKKVSTEQLDEFLKRMRNAEAQALEYKELLKEISRETENFTGKFLTSSGNVNFSKIMKLLTSMQFGGNTSKIKDELGVEGIFIIKHKIDEILKNE